MQKKRKLVAIHKYKQNLKIFDILLFVLGICGVMFEDAFLFNPIILPCFFLSYNRGLRQFILCSLGLVTVALIKNPLYALELFLLFFVFLTANYLILKISTNKHKKYVGIGFINLLLFIATLSASFSISTALSIFMVFFAEIAILYSLESFLSLLKDDTSNATTISLSLFFVVMAFSFMFFVNTGLLVLRVFILLAIYTSKREVGLLTLAISFVLLSALFEYSFSSLIMIFLPLLGALVFTRFKEIAFLVLHMLSIFLVETPILYNAHFYQGLAAILIIIVIPHKIMDYIKTLANRTQNNQIMRLVNREVLFQQQLLYVTNYLDVIEQSVTSEVEDPVIKGKNRVLARVCTKCSHVDYCALKRRIPELLQDKLKTQIKKEINEICLSPYKLTMELQQAYNLFIDEQSYFYDAMERKDQYVFAVKKLVTPIAELQKLKKQSLETTLMEKLADQNLNIKYFGMKDDVVIVKFERRNFENCATKLIEYLNLYTKETYILADESYDVLQDEYNLILTKFIGLSYDFGVISKAITPNFNGDSYTTIVINDCLHVLLSDGMGHGKKAMENSQYLIKAVTAQLNLTSDIHEMLLETNNLLLMRSGVEQYATLDYARLNLKSLEATFVKAGCFTSYLRRKNFIEKISNSGIPLGIIKSPEVGIINTSLEKNDLLIMVSDGIGEMLDDIINELIINSETSAQEVARLVFSQLEKDNLLIDDATIITIKIM